MFVTVQIVALCLAADAAPSYTVHIRELTTPEKAIHVPLTDSVAILDAVAALKRSPRDLARMDLWIVRRAEGGKINVLRVDWAAITQRGVTATNNQMLAGDRLFLQARPAK
jgi:polysaccharide export outer membrane protein